MERILIPGSEWLYFKIYAGHNTCDNLLTELMRPIAQRLIDDGLITKWFFIRYADPENHLRVRFHCSDASNIGIILKYMFSDLEAFVRKGMVWKVQIDTYNREVERYGQATMELSETLFFHDSKMVVDLLEIIDGPEGESLRWLFALKAVDQLLDAFRYTPEEKLRIMKRLKIGFAREFNIGKTTRKDLNKK